MCSVQFSHSVVSVSLRPHEQQHTTPPCPSPTFGACSNSCPSSWTCHPAISSNQFILLLPFLIFPSIRVFFNESVLHIRWPNIGASASASVLAMNIQDISLLSKGLSKVFSNTAVLGINSLALSLLYGPTLTSVHDCWEKP